MNNIAHFTDNNIYQQVRACIEKAIPPNTARAFSVDLKSVRGWIRCVFGTDVWPLTEQDVLQYILHQLNGMPPHIEQELIQKKLKKKPGILAMNTVKRRLSSISLAHAADGYPDPTKSEYVKSLLSALHKSARKEKRSKPITKEILNKMLDTCENNIIGIRDRAMLLFAWSSGGRRRSEVLDALVCDLHKQTDGNYVYRMPRSKTDQEGKGQEVPVKGPAAKAMTKWLQISGIKKGHIFRAFHDSGAFKDTLYLDEFNKMVKLRLKKAKIDPKYYSSHGVRRGFVSEAGKQGIPIGDIMAMTGHKSIAIAMQYYDAGNLLNNRAADLL